MIYDSEKKKSSQWFSSTGISQEEEDVHAGSSPSPVEIPFSIWVEEGASVILTLLTPFSSFSIFLNSYPKRMWNLYFSSSRLLLFWCWCLSVQCLWSCFVQFYLSLNLSPLQSFTHKSSGIHTKLLLWMFRFRTSESSLCSSLFLWSWHLRLPLHSFTLFHVVLLQQPPQTPLKSFFPPLNPLSLLPYLIPFDFLPSSHDHLGDFMWA